MQVDLKGHPCQSPNEPLDHPLEVLEWLRGNSTLKVWYHSLARAGVYWILW
jgi:hypothetical protein